MNERSEYRIHVDADPGNRSYQSHAMYLSEERPKKVRRIWTRLQTSLLAVVLCAVAVAALGIDYLLRPQQFPLKHINIQGDLQNAQPGQIRSAIAQVAATNILRIDVVKAAEAVQSVPWIEEAIIRREWPDTLVVYVNERVIQSRWNEDLWLDHLGTPVRLPADVGLDLPHLKGPTNSAQEMLAQYQTWQNTFSKEGLDITTLEMSGRNSWNIEFLPVNDTADERSASGDASVVPNNIKVVLGSINPQLQVERFLWLYREVLSPVGEWIESVDMRYPNGISVRWIGGKPRLEPDEKFKLT